MKIVLYLILVIMTFTLCSCSEHAKLGSQEPLHEDGNEKSMSDSSEQASKIIMLLNENDRLKAEIEKLENDNKVLETDTSISNNSEQTSKITILINENERLKEEIERLKNDSSVIEGDINEMKTKVTKYFFGWVKVSDEVELHNTPHEDSHVIDTLHEEMVWVYDSFMDQNFETWLMVITDDINPSIGYIRDGDNLEKIFNSPNKRISVESLGGIKLGDVIQSADDVFKNEYILYDHLYGSGRIYPVKYNYKNNDKNDDYDIKLLTDEKSDNINLISIRTEGYSLGSGISVGDPIDLIELYYGNDNIEKGERLIKVTTVNNESISFNVTQDNRIWGITLAFSDYSFPP